MTPSRSPSKILWLQVIGLALLIAAIALLWLVYNLFLGSLLKQFNYSDGFVASILVIESGIAVLMEPLMGRFSDQTLYWVGSRFPWIMGGVILSSALTLGIPLMIMGHSSLAGVLLPAVLIAWATAMAIFRSPVLSLLGNYAYGSALPEAASLLTIAGAAIGCLRPLATEQILRLGPMLAFGCGAVILLLAATFLRWIKPEVKTPAAETEFTQSVSQKATLKSLALIFVAGFGLSGALRIQITIFPKFLATVPHLDPRIGLGLIFLATVLTALPAGKFGRQIGNERALLIGLLGLSVLLLGVPFVQTVGMAVVIAIATGLCLSFIQNGTIPYVFSRVPAHRRGLGVGMYFGGASLIFSILGLLSPEFLTSFVGVGMAIAGLALTALSIALNSPQAQE